MRLYKWIKVGSYVQYDSLRFPVLSRPYVKDGELVCKIRNTFLGRIEEVPCNKCVRV
jgi:hypothetical protein